MEAVQGPVVRASGSSKLNASFLQTVWGGRSRPTPLVRGPKRLSCSLGSPGPVRAAGAGGAAAGGPGASTCPTRCPEARDWRGPRGEGPQVRRQHRRLRAGELVVLPTAWEHPAGNRGLPSRPGRSVGSGGPGPATSRHPLCPRGLAAQKGRRHLCLPFPRAPASAGTCSVLGPRHPLPPPLGPPPSVWTGVKGWRDRCLPQLRAKLGRASGGLLLRGSP